MTFNLEEERKKIIDKIMEMYKQQSPLDYKRNSRVLEKQLNGCNIKKLRYVLNKYESATEVKREVWIMK